MEWNPNEFYNSDTKIQYLTDLLNTLSESSVSNQGVILKRIKRFEEEFDKDFCNFSYEQVLIALNKNMGRNPSTKFVTITALRQYVEWCIANGKSETNQNPLDGINVADISSAIEIRTGMISSSGQLERLLDIVYESAHSDTNSVNIIYRLIFWLLFDGFNLSEVITLTKDSVNFEENIIKHPTTNKQISLSPIVKELCLIAQDLKEIYLVRSNGKETHYALEDGDFLIRRRKTKLQRDNRELWVRFIFNQFNLKYQDTTFQASKLSPDRLYESGVYCRIYKSEKDVGIVPDKLFEYNCDDNIGDGWKEQKRKNNKRKYKEWKEAFEL